jgi:hypothetical protein
MESADQLTTLAILIALSAYLATIRLLAIERISRQTDKDKKQEIRLKLLWLVVPDSLLTVSALLLGFHIFSSYLAKHPGSLLAWSIWLFAAAGLLLFLSHIVAWSKTIAECWKHKSP